MNMRVDTPAFRLQSAFQQLDAVERDFVDSYVDDLRRRADNQNRPVLDLAQEPVPSHVWMTSRNLIERQIVQAAIFERVQAVDMQSGLSPWKIIADLVDLTNFNLADYTDVDPYTGKRVFTIEHCTEEQLKRLSELTLKEGPLGGRELKVKGYDRLDVYKMLLKFMGAAEAGNKYWFDYETKQNSAKKKQATGGLAAGVDGALIYSRELAG